MKAKISPTSPKSENGKANDLGKIYDREFGEIEKPKSGKHQSQIWLLFVVVILGFFAGVISQLVIFSYGQDIPFLSKLGLFNDITQIYNITRQKNDLTNNSAKNQIVTEISPAVVTVYRQSTSAGDLSGILSDADRLGVGLAVTDDGYIVTLKSIISSNSKLSVMTWRKELLPVQSIIADPASDFVFLKISSVKLSVVPFAQAQSIVQLDQVMGLTQNYSGSISDVVFDTLSSLTFQPAKSVQDLIVNSDTYNSKMLLSNTYKDAESRIVFTQKGEALGILYYSDGYAAVTTFDQMTSIVNQLSENSIKRPMLGVRYFDLSLSNNLDQSITHDLASGALITSDDEKNRPSIISKGPAQKAGLQKGDIITAVDGQNITSVVKLNELILSKKPGDTISVEFNRKNIEKEVKITLSSI